jgi:hypothetical protein
LARETAAEDVDALDGAGPNRSNVSMIGNLWPVLFQDGAREGIDLREPPRNHSGAL